MLARQYRAVAGIGGVVLWGRRDSTTKSSSLLTPPPARLHRRFARVQMRAAAAAVLPVATASR
eukprot:3043355-Prymnesium_polylepis.1